jgi:hypothetical protein
MFKRTSIMWNSKQCYIIRCDAETFRVCSERIPNSKQISVAVCENGNTIIIDNAWLTTVRFARQILDESIELKVSRNFDIVVAHTNGTLRIAAKEEWWTTIQRRLKRKQARASK